MQRENMISQYETDKRRAQAQQFYAQDTSPPDSDILADHELFILGKMDLEEYEQYLLFKHSQPSPSKGDLSQGDSKCQSKK